MAKYRVWSGGDNTGGADNANWSQAYQTLSAAILAATATGDIIYVNYTHTENLAADTTYTTLANNISIVCVNKDSGETLAQMGASAWIGHDSTNRSITITSPALKLYVYGITLRVVGTTADNIAIGGSDGAHSTYENCYFWTGNSTTSGIRIGAGGDSQSFCHVKNCTFRFSQTDHKLLLSSRVLIEGGSISSSGVAIQQIFASATSTDLNGCELVVEGFDMSAASSTASICYGSQQIPLIAKLSRCKLPSGAISYVSTNSGFAGRTCAELTMYDCSSGDSHLSFVFANEMGSVELVDSIKISNSPANCSWKITTTTDVSFLNPFICPWIDVYNTNTVSITPYFEILKDGTTTPMTTKEVWAEFSVKTTVNSTLSSFFNDRQSLDDYFVNSTAQSQSSGVGLGSWIGWTGAPVGSGDDNAWSGKCDSGTSLTPAEIGYIRGRLVVAAQSAVVYCDPMIRV
jgi:hypothetical protein